MTTIERIREATKARGIKLNWLSAKAGLHPRSLYQNAEPTRATLKAIASILQVDWRSLLGD